MSEKLNEITQRLNELTLLEASELVKSLEEKWGVSASAVSVAAPSEVAGAEAAEEKTEFDVVLVKGSEKKMDLIKALRSVTTLGLKEAKEMAESSDVVVKSGVSKKDAEDTKKILEGAGAEVKLA